MIKLALKILVTGPPRCGKSSLIKKLVNFFPNEDSLTIRGFFTPEVKEKGQRIGFDIEDVVTGERVALARVGNFKTQYRLGKYNIFIKEFEQYLSNLCDFADTSLNLIMIDEIGKMELYSKIFENFIRKIFVSDYRVIATIGQRLDHSLVKWLKILPKIYLFELSRNNNSLIYRKIKQLIMEY